MQEEIKKHGKKIFSIAANPKANVTKKVKEVFLEILIIFIAVSISVWFHNYNEKRHQQQEVKEFLVDVKDDLLKDRATYLRNVQFHIEDSLFLKQIIGINKDNINTTELNIAFKVRTLTLSCGNYEGFKTSGKIGYIKNKELKKKILAYYENQMPSLKYGQNYYMQESSSFVSNVFENTQNMSKFLCSTRVKYMASNCLGVSSSIKKNFEDLIKEIDVILREINKEVSPH